MKKLKKIKSQNAAVSRETSIQLQVQWRHLKTKTKQSIIQIRKKPSFLPILVVQQAKWKCVYRSNRMWNDWNETRLKKPTFLLVASASACNNSLVLSASCPATIFVGFAEIGFARTKADQKQNWIFRIQTLTTWYLKKD